jgi:hypothetical protein
VRARLAIAAALGGVAILATVVVIVFQFGRHNPSPPSLEKSPNAAIPGEILYVGRHNCLVRAAASGAERREVCIPAMPYFEPFAWSEPDAFVAWRGGEFVRVDLATGMITRIATAAPPYRYPERPPLSVNGERATAEGGDLVILTRTGREKIASFDVGSSWMEPILWSPDGNWIVVQWSRPRGEGWELWIVSRDGSVRGTIADDAGGMWVAWRIEGVGFTPSLAEIGAPASRAR